MRWRSAVVIAAITTTLTAGCAETPTVPDVAGLRLDQAHHTLEEAGYSDVDDIDLFQDREPVWDAIFDSDDDWAVIRQRPAPGTPLPHDDSIRLEILNKRDPQIIDQLPPHSPVLDEFQRSAADAQASSADESARRTAAENKPLDCAPPTFEVTSQTWDVTNATPTAPAQLKRASVVVRIQNKSEHKIATAGIVFTTGYRDNFGNTRSTKEYGGLSLSTETVPEQSPAGAQKWTVIDPFRTTDFDRTFGATTEQRFKTDGTAPWMDEVFVNWHFDNPDLDDLCH